MGSLEAPVSHYQAVGDPPHPPKEREDTEGSVVDLTRGRVMFKHEFWQLLSLANKVDFIVKVEIFIHLHSIHFTDAFIQSSISNIL